MIHLKIKKTKTMIDCDFSECNSTKLIDIKRITTVDITSRFIKGKIDVCKCFAKQFYLRYD